MELYLASKKLREVVTLDLVIEKNLFFVESIIERVNNF